MGTENTDGGTLQKQNFINYYVQHIVVFRLLLLIYTSLEKKSYSRWTIYRHHAAYDMYVKQ